MLFSEHLRRLLERESITPIDLAVHLGVDVSLLYRWLRGDRVPGSRSSHVSRIADYLNLDPTAARHLQAAQAYSLGLSREERVSPQAHPTNSIPAPPPAGKGLHKGVGGLDEGHRDPMISLPRAIVGKQAVIEALLLLIQQLPKPTPPHDLLVLTSQGEELFAHNDDLRHKWLQALRDALGRGWRVEQYTRLGDDPKRHLHIAGSLLALLSAGGSYRLFALPGRDLLSPAQDFFLGPPSIGALLLVATNQGQHSDAASVIQHPGQVAQLRGYLRQLTAAATAVARPFPRDSRAEYWHALTEIEERPGDRWQIKEGLSVLTRPPGWYAEGAPWWRAHGHTAASATLWRRRMAAFERHLRPKRGGFRHRDIIPQQSLETYVATGIHPADLRADGQAMPDTVAERLEHIERLLDLLKSDYYELALIHGQAELSYYGQVKTNQAALLQVYGKGGSEHAERIDYIVDALPIANGIAAAFEEQWRGLAVHERDKQTIRPLIAAKRDALRGMLRRARPQASPKVSG